MSTYTVTPAHRRKMVAGLRRALAKRKRLAKTQATTNTNGQVNGLSDSDRKNTVRKTARTEVLELARMGAQIRLKELERETTKLRIFLGGFK